MKIVEVVGPEVECDKAVAKMQEDYSKEDFGEVKRLRDGQPDGSFNVKITVELKPHLVKYFREDVCNLPGVQTSMMEQTNTVS